MGWFYFYVKQVNDKDWFGIGAFLVLLWFPSLNVKALLLIMHFFSRLNGVSLTPTYAHKFDDKWSAAVGAEINYAGLELQKNINSGKLGTTQIKGGKLCF